MDRMSASASAESCPNAQFIKSIRDRMQAFCRHPGIHGWGMFIDIVSFDNADTKYASVE